MGQSPSSDAYSINDSGKPFLQGNAEFGSKYPFPKNFCNTATKVAPPDSLLLSVRAPVGALNIADREYGIWRGLCSVFTDNSMLVREYTWYALAITRHQLWSIATGSTYDAVSVDEVAAMALPVPPLDEQRAIAAFLDRETTRIDALIDKKRRQINLLHQKRAALISHAVTKGLDPNAPMKDSGVEWLGEVPAHWQVPPLYARFSVELGKMLDEKRITGEHLLPYVRNVDVQWDRVNIADLPEMDIMPNEYSRYTLKAGDLLVCEGGEVGRTALWGGELAVCAFQKAIHRLRPITDQDLPRFLYYVMRAAAFTGVFIAQGNPNTIPHLTAEKLRVYRFPFPPTDEQRAIVGFLDCQTSKIDVLAEKINLSIDRLREYRTALISAAVTGKIDVRKEVA
jgi:type I restriction enzyme S subunit